MRSLRCCGANWKSTTRSRGGVSAWQRSTADLPPVDAVRIARESREELEQRIPR